MNKTKNILTTIKNMLNKKQIRPQDIPIDDIIDCVKNEIELRKNTYTQDQYTEIKDYFEFFCQDIKNSVLDQNNVNLFIDGMFILLSTISKSVYSLINKDYWTYKYGTKASDPEIAEIIDYIDRKRDLQLLNYDFVDKYNDKPLVVYHDEKYNMCFVQYKGRKMYFPSDWDEARIIDYYYSVVSEQDSHSPHCYKKDGYEVKKDSVIFDVGAAEGIFSLDYIDIASRIYLIEADSQWVEALQHTFANDMDKVTIIHGYAGDNSRNSNEISLDSLINECQIGYIKMDIEGSEKMALMGAQKNLSTISDIRCAICSYHFKDDELWIRNFLSEMGFETDTSRGYMFPDWEPGSVINAELRRGIVFGRKKM